MDCSACKSLLLPIVTSILFCAPSSLTPIIVWSASVLSAEIRVLCSNASASVTGEGLRPDLGELPDLLRDISQLLVGYLFAPREHMNMPHTLFRVIKGLAAKLGKPLITGSVGGIDFICARAEDMDATAPLTLTHVEPTGLSI